MRIGEGGGDVFFLKGGNEGIKKAYKRSLGRGRYERRGEERK